MSAVRNPEETPSLGVRMRAWADAHPDMTPEMLAAGFVRTAKREDLVPLVARAFAEMQRHSVRAIEVSMMAQKRRTSRVTMESVQAKLGELAPLLNQTYRIGDGVERKAGRMTIAEWEARKQMLLADRNGIDRAIEVCDRAMALIRKHNVLTLDAIQ